MRTLTKKWVSVILYKQLFTNIKTNDIINKGDNNAKEKYLYSN